MSNTFGQLFRVTTFGESHGGGIGVVIDGSPPRIAISEADIQRELDRRRPGQSKLTTQRKEEDQCEILSGIFEGKTLGTPIAIAVRNKDARPEDYRETAGKFRPSHADYTYEAKYGIRNWHGGGRASARETVGRVAAGAVAKKVLSTFYPDFEIVTYVAQIHDIVAKINRSTVKMKDVEKNIVRCPDVAEAKRMISLIEQVRDEGDSIGGVIECVARGQWFAALAGCLSFFCRGADLVRGGAWVATGFASSIDPAGCARRCVYCCVFRRQSASSACATPFQNA